MERGAGAVSGLSRTRLAPNHAAAVGDLKAAKEGLHPPNSAQDRSITLPQYCPTTAPRHDSCAAGSNLPLARALIQTSPHADYASDPLALPNRLARDLAPCPVQACEGRVRALWAATRPDGGPLGRRAVVGRRARWLARRARPASARPAPARYARGTAAMPERPRSRCQPACYPGDPGKLPSPPRSESQSASRPRRVLPALPHAARRARAPPDPVAQRAPQPGRRGPVRTGTSRLTTRDGRSS